MYSETSGEIQTNEKEKYVSHVPGSLILLLKLNKRRDPDVINEHILERQTLKTNITRLLTVNQAVISHICAFLKLRTIAFQIPFFPPSSSPFWTLIQPLFLLPLELLSLLLLVLSY